MKVLIFPASLVLQLFQAAAGQAGFDWRIRQSCFNPHVCINLSFLLPAFHTVGLFARVWEYRREQAKAQILLRVWLKHPVDCQRNRWCRNSFLAAATTYPENIACPNSILELWTSLHFHLIPLLYLVTLCFGKTWWPELLNFHQFHCLSNWGNNAKFLTIFLCVLCWFHFLSPSSLWSYFLKCYSKLPSPSILPIKENQSLMFQPATLLWWYSKVCP